MRRRTFLVSTAALAACSRLPIPTQAPNERLRGVVSRMSVDDKVGQIMSVAFHGTSIPSSLDRLIREQRVGSVIVFKENIASPAALGSLLKDLQALAAEAKLPPFLFLIDQEGGTVVRLGKGATVLPSQMALAATPDPADSVRRAVAVTAEECRALGLNFVLAPVADVNASGRDAIILDRSFGSDARRVADLTTVAVGAYREAGLLCCAKHFPGHGDVAVDPHAGLPELDRDVDRLERVELVPFRAAVGARVPAVMTAHIRLPALDGAPNVSGTLSKAVVSGLLRDRLGFNGVVVTDDLEMGAITKHFPTPDAAAMAFAAGADLLLFRFDVDAQRAAHRGLVERVRRGEIPMERLEASVLRVMLAKEQAGDPRQPAAERVGTPANRAVALDLARRSVTLLWNRGALPLGAKNVLVISPRPRDLRFDEALVDDQLSFGDQLARLRNVTRRDLPLRPNPFEHAGLALDAARHDLVVVATYLTAKYKEQASLVQTLAGIRPVVVVALRSPHDAADVREASAFLCTYHTRDVGCEAAAEIVVGARAPEGKLPVEVPGHFPLGAGLTSL